MTTEQKVADALRTASLRLEAALRQGRSNQIDAEDFLETLLTIADQLDPPLLELVHPPRRVPVAGNGTKTGWSGRSMTASIAAGARRITFPRPNRRVPR